MRNVRARERLSVKDESRDRLWFKAFQSDFTESARLHSNRKIGLGCILVPTNTISYSYGVGRFRFSTLKAASQKLLRCS